MDIAIISFSIILILCGYAIGRVKTKSIVRDMVEDEIWRVIDTKLQGTNSIIEIKDKISALEQHLSVSYVSEHKKEYKKVV